MKFNFFKLSLFVFAITIASLSYAQDRIIHGIVTTFDSIPLHGATVRVASTKQTTLTDTLGNFSIGCDTKDKLKVSANGFLNENVKLEASSKFAAVNLKLKSGSKNLEAAYEYTRLVDRDKLNALSAVSADDLDLSMYRDIFEAVKGKFPGVQVSGSSFIVRGTGSISGPTPALVILDGMPVQGASLSALNPSTVKTIKIIKDGSSAVYGSRGAFGVVEITTKTGN